MLFACKCLNVSLVAPTSAEAFEANASGSVDVGGHGGDNVAADGLRAASAVGIAAAELRQARLTTTTTVSGDVLQFLKKVLAGVFDSSIYGRNSRTRKYILPAIIAMCSVLSTQ